MSKATVAQPTSLLKAISSSQTYSQVYQVTPEFASFLRSQCVFELQRALSKSNIARLEFEMANRTFIRGAQIFICVLPDGSWRMVNGNHTCQAIKGSGLAQDLTLTFIHVANLDEVGRVYSCLDGQKVRTLTDKLKATGEECSHFARSCNAALTLIISGFTQHTSTHVTRSIDQRKPYLDLYRDAQAMVAMAIDGGSSDYKAKIRIAPYLAVALETMRHQPSAAFDFWHDIAHDQTAQDSPGRLLARYMLKSSVSGSTERSMAWKTAARAWNAYFNKETPKTLQAGSMDEIKLIGTSFHRGRSAILKPVMGAVRASDAPSADELLENGVTLNGSGVASATAILRAN